jgi:hypothetical protein
VLEHQAAAIDRLVIFEPSPIGVKLLVFATATALLDMKVILLIVQVHDSAATIAPDNGQLCALDVYFHRHKITSLPNQYNRIHS